MYRETQNIKEQTYQAEVLGWLDSEYELTIAALGELGFGEGDGLPPLEPIRDTVLSRHAGWLAGRLASGAQDELSLPPRVQDYGLRGTKQEPGLLRRYDAKQRWLFKSHQDGPWKKMDDKNPLHDNYAPENFQPGILLGDHRGDEEPGLVYGQGFPTFDQMRKAFDQEQAKAAIEGRDLKLITISDFILSAAKRRLAGKPRMVGTTAFVHYPDSIIDYDQADANANKVRTRRVTMLPTATTPAMGGNSLALEYRPSANGIRRFLSLEASR